MALSFAFYGFSAFAEGPVSSILLIAYVLVTGKSLCGFKQICALIFGHQEVREVLKYYCGYPYARYYLHIQCLVFRSKSIRSLIVLFSEALGPYNRLYPVVVYVLCFITA